jgi:hypothetical protein
MSLHPVVGVERVVALMRARALDLEDETAIGAEHAIDCRYHWQVSVHEWGLRIDGVLEDLRESAAEAVGDALNFRDELLACGFTEIYRTELGAARMEDEDDDHRTLGWRGRFNVGLAASLP